MYAKRTRPLDVVPFFKKIKIKIKNVCVCDVVINGAPSIDLATAKTEFDAFHSNKMEIMVMSSERESAA